MFFCLPNILLLLHQRFPTDAFIRHRWVKNIKILNNQVSVNTNGTVCSTHFEEICKQSYYEFSNTTLKAGSIPTIFVNSNGLERFVSSHFNYIYLKKYSFPTFLAKMSKCFILKMRNIQWNMLHHRVLNQFQQHFQLRTTKIFRPI